ncbi:MAG: NUDIX hydrolase [bacterium]
MQQPKIISSKILYKDDYTKVFEVKIRKPDNRISTRVRMQKRSFVVVVPINHQKQVLFGREFRSALRKTVWMVPTGFVDSKESPKQTAKRELLEETGLLAKKLIPLYNLNGSSEYQQKGFAFLAVNLTKDDSVAPEYKTVLTSFEKTTEMALKNKLGDRIGLVVLAAIEKYKKF